MKFMVLLTSFIFSFTALALDNGSVVPDFKLQAASGKQVSLSDFKGKFVVLEWKNHGCPFVRKHYDSQNMQTLQQKYTAKGVVWLSIISSAEGKQGYVDAAGAKADIEKYKSHATDVLLDPKGDVGRLYEAKTTPHMFVLDKAGILVYQGAIDSIADTEKESVPKAVNYVAKALDEVMAGKKVAKAKTQSYGCSVKY